MNQLWKSKGKLLKILSKMRILKMMEVFIFWLMSIVMKKKKKMKTSHTLSLIKRAIF